MNTWILIILMFGDGKAAQSIEFNSFESCKAAANQIGDQLRLGGGPIQTFCVKK